MGGAPPLGYDPPGPGSRALVVNDAEAATAQRIFESYLDLGSVHDLERRLRAEGVVSKRRTTAKGRVLGGRPLSRGALFHLLRNRTYLGRIVHKGVSHPGLHPAIVEQALFDAVQDRFATQTRRRRAGGDAEGCDRRGRRVARAPLTGRIVDAEEQPMSPSFAYGKMGKLYRYYVSAPLQQGRARPAGDAVLRRVSAVALEAALAEALDRLAPSAGGDTSLALIERVEVRDDALELWLPIRFLPMILERLMDQPLPLDWRRQAEALGFRYAEECRSGAQTLA